jgi:hypothetical protein
MLIIIQKDVYHQNVNDFITQNRFTKVPNNYTNKEQKGIKTAINACKTTIRQADKWKYTNMNPKAPHIYGTIKLQKADRPIRPIVNWKNSPGYKLAGHLVKLLKHTTRLPNVFNVQNSETLMHSLKQTSTQSSTKMCSFDIKNMYTIIPLDELINIIHTTLARNNIPDDHKYEIITLVKVMAVARSV